MNALQELTTQEEFRRLPLLLNYSQVLACGIKAHDLQEWIESGQITYVQLHDGGRRRYRKCDLAKVLGLQM